MYKIEITTEAVGKVLRKFKENKSTGPDNIHPKLLRDCAENVAEPLAKIKKNH